MSTNRIESSGPEQLQSFEPEPVCTGPTSEPAPSVPAPAQAKPAAPRDEVVEHHEAGGFMSKVSEWAHEQGEWLESRKESSVGFNGIADGRTYSSAQDDKSLIAGKPNIASNEWKLWEKEGSLTGPLQLGDDKNNLVFQGGYAQSAFKATNELRQDGTREQALTFGGSVSAAHLTGKMTDEATGTTVAGKVDVLQAGAEGKGFIENGPHGTEVGAGFKLSANLISAEVQAKAPLIINGHEVGSIKATAGGEVGAGVAAEVYAKAKDGKIKLDAKAAAAAGPGATGGVTAELEGKAFARESMKAGVSSTMASLGAAAERLSAGVMGAGAARVKKAADEAEAKGNPFVAAQLRQVAAVPAFFAATNGAIADTIQRGANLMSRDNKWVDDIGFLKEEAEGVKK